MAENSACGCTVKGDCSIFTTQPISYAMAYVPYQSWERLYDPAIALDRGTIFPCLDKANPSMGR